MEAMAKAVAKTEAAAQRGRRWAGGGGRGGGPGEVWGGRPEDVLMRAYHDEEWGVPLHDARALWELLMLEGFQAGLSWSVILRKREAFRKAFKGFDPKKVARFTEADIERLMQDEGIVRARAKIEATINGAKIYL